MVFRPKNEKVLHTWLFLAIIVVAILARVPDLDRRPMHTDEAVHALKFGMLLEDGFYRYDPVEYHGPTLNYFTLIPAWLASASSLAEVDETTLRIVPAVFGIGLVALLLLVLRPLGWRVVIAAGLLTAISPGLVFTSRYYIQEILLVFFAFAAIGCGVRYASGRKVGWAIATGVSLGLMHATKETAIIAFGSMVLALILMLWVRVGRFKGVLAALREIEARHLIVAGLAAVAVSALFYSSFFTNPAGVLDSYTTYASYLDKAATNEWHIHPWDYYLGLLISPNGLPHLFWSEAFILALAALGVLAALSGSSKNDAGASLVRFVIFYSIIMITIYSAIPYKTPWIMLGFVHGLILLAGIGAVALIDIKGSGLVRGAALAILVLGCAHLALQSYLSNTVYYADTANPYVYAHPTDDGLDVVARIQDVAAVHPEGNDMYIEVISPEHDYWPLPWYLREFSHVGWWGEVDMEVPAAPLIIAKPAVEPALLRKLYEVPPPGERDLYVPLLDSYAELRPTVEIRGYVVKSLWDQYQQQR
jgi:uncharacterized protein (TIGR03663 family)